VKFHRDAPEPPTTLEDKKAGIVRLESHKMWSHATDMHSFSDLTEFMYVYVNPVNETIENDTALNTVFRIWVEAGPTWDRNTDEHMDNLEENDSDRWGMMHDTRMDTGAPDMETLLLKLLTRVEFFYNEDGSSRTEAPECCGGHFTDERALDENWVDDCVKGDDGYCTACGFEVD
jgi:hypothetical protein